MVHTFFAWEQHVDFFGKKTFCCALMTVFHNMAAETKLHLNLDCVVVHWTVGSLLLTVSHRLSGHDDWSTTIQHCFWPHKG